jgi:hypothetical protein
MEVLKDGFSCEMIFSRVRADDAMQHASTVANAIAQEERCFVMNIKDLRRRGFPPP